MEGARHRSVVRGRRPSLVLLVCASAAPFAVACGSPAASPLVTSYPTPSETGATMAAAQPQTSPPATATAPPAPSVSSITASTLPGPPSLGLINVDASALAHVLGVLGAAVSPNFTQQSPSPDAVEAGLHGQQLRLAPGMAAEGPLLEQRLQKGQHTSMQVPMQHGKCYVILGWSEPGDVKELDLLLLAPPLYNVLTAGSSTSHNAPYLGGDAAVPPKPMCPIWPVPLQYKLDVFARDGSGAVAVQVYSRPAP